MHDDPAAPEVPEWLHGSWRRAWIRRGATRASDVAVHYVQTPRMFADLRVLDARPRVGATSFADATDADLSALAEQWGFAGFATADGDVVTWHHELDFQPDEPGEVDVGRVERVGNAMLEHALDGAYTELWWRVASGDGRYFAAERRAGGRLEGLLVVAGDAFMYVRDRAVPLPEAKSLRELVDDPNRGRAAKISYLDCEISAGRARGGARPWAIERSTLPWREGCALDPPFSVRAGALTMREGWVAVTSTFALEDLALLSDVDGGN